MMTSPEPPPAGNVALVGESEYVHVTAVVVVVVVGTLVVVGSGVESDRSSVNESKPFSGLPGQSGEVLPPLHVSVCGPSGPEK